MSRCSAGYSDPCSTCNTSSDLNSIALAIAWPWNGPSSSVRRISRSSVPWSSSTRSRCSAVDILGENIQLPVECQGEQPGHAGNVRTSASWGPEGVTGKLMNHYRFLGLSKVALRTDAGSKFAERPAFPTSVGANGRRGLFGFQQFDAGSGEGHDGLKQRRCSRRVIRHIQRERRVLHLHAVVEYANPDLGRGVVSRRNIHLL